MAIPSVLTLDCGNSRLKASLFRGETLLGSTVMETLSLRDTESLWQGTDVPEGGIYCRVGRSPEESALDALADALGGRLMTLTHTTPLPVGIRYSTRTSLGLDRVAGACGAAALFPGESVLVADAGTALTLDVVERGATFCGGNISPGISLRFRALHGFTSALPLVGREGELCGFGHDTVTAIRAGVVGGIADEIIAATRRAADSFGILRLLLTGGDAPFLLPILSDLTSNLIDFPEIRFCPDIVGRGLVSIYNYNR